MKFKVGDFVEDKNLSGGIFYEISKIEGDVFWLFVKPKRIFQPEHQYSFSFYPNLKKFKNSKSNYEIYY